MRVSCILSPGQGLPAAAEVSGRRSFTVCFLVSEAESPPRETREPAEGLYHKLIRGAGCLTNVVFREWVWERLLSDPETIRAIHMYIYICI